MASLDQVKAVECIIGREFASKTYIRVALTAAGAEDKNHEGNRALAHIGASWIEALLNIVFMHMGLSKERKAELRLEFTRREHFVHAAKRSGISKYIKYSCRSGVESPTVLRNTINAVVASVLLDAGDNIPATLLVLFRIFKRPDTQLIDGFSEATADAVSAVANAALTTETGIAGIVMGLPIEQLPPLQVDVQQQNAEGLELPQTFPSLDHNSMWGLGPQAPSETDTCWTTAHSGDQIGDVSQICHPRGIIDDTTQDIPAGPNALTAFDWKAQFMTDVLPMNSTLDHGIVQELPMNAVQYTSLTVSSDTPYKALSSGSIGPERLPSTEERNQKKRKRGGSTSAFNTSDKFKGFLANEKAKCASQGLSPPDATYLTPRVYAELMKPKNKYDEALTGLLVFIASPHAIVALGGIIRELRNHDKVESFGLRDDIPRATRFHLIERLICKTSTIQVISWYHILEMFRECGGQNGGSSGYVHCTPATFQQGQTTIGNPKNVYDSKVAEAMMAEIFPDIEPDTQNYRSLLRRVKKLRKVSKRLHTLTETFGQGILGLMLDNTLGSQLDNSISNTTISESSEEEFSRFIGLLRHSQDCLLRKFSDAAWRILKPLLSCTLSERETFRIEQMGPEEILKHPKGSDGLLNCIQ